MNRLRHHAIWPMLLLLASCAFFQGPKTIPETLAFNYATIEALANSATSSLRAGSITSAKATDVKSILEEAYKINRLAETAYIAGYSDDATGYMRMVSEILTQLEGML